MWSLFITKLVYVSLSSAYIQHALSLLSLSIYMFVLLANVFFQHDCHIVTIIIMTILRREDYLSQFCIYFFKYNLLYYDDQISTNSRLSTRVICDEENYFVPSFS